MMQTLPANPTVYICGGFRLNDERGSVGSAHNTSAHQSPHASSTSPLSSSSRKKKARTSRASHHGGGDDDADKDQHKEEEGEEDAEDHESKPPRSVVIPASLHEIL